MGTVVRILPNCANCKYYFKSNKGCSKFHYTITSGYHVYTINEPVKRCREIENMCGPVGKFFKQKTNDKDNLANLFEIFDN